MSARVGHEGSIDAGVVSVTSVGDIGRIATEWDALAERSGSIFSTALWARLWWEHFGGDRELLVHAARTSDGSLATVLPLYAWRRRLPRARRFLGHGPGDELGPVHSRGADATAASALRSALGGLEWDLFLGEQLPGDEGWPALHGGSTWRREASPSLTLPATWD
jgi:CelD/BcsL family acetyltransferase involved in cellulose biosynthesis